MKALLFILTAAMALSALTLSVDSVAIDSVWNSDSAGVERRDCRLSFVLRGDMRCVWFLPAVSFDGGVTWFQDSIACVDNSFGVMVDCNSRKTVHVRIAGGDRNNVVVRVDARMPIPELSPIPGGVFNNGVSDVNVSAFQMATTEMTQELYTAIMGANPSSFRGSANAPLPVESVSWYDAALFCNALSQLYGKDTVYAFTPAIDWKVAIGYDKDGFRLPTEAEWEYACRAGTRTDYYWGLNFPPLSDQDTAMIDSHVVWQHNSGNVTRAVCGRKPNGFGLYDMYGNVYEWCNDWYGGYPPGEQTDPTGAVSGTINRVIRGGCWNIPDADFICSGTRGSSLPTNRYSVIGFRIAARGYHVQ